MKRATLFFVLISLLLCQYAAAGNLTSIAGSPPVVFRSVPQSGAVEVDPALRTIEVTFSKRMNTRQWSWAMDSRSTFPQKNGDVYFLQDGQTCIMPVKLEPQKFYAIWINTATEKEFQDAAGNPAVPYLITFETRKPTE